MTGTQGPGTGSGSTAGGGIPAWPAGGPCVDNLSADGALAHRELPRRPAGPPCSQRRQPESPGGTRAQPCVCIRASLHPPTLPASGGGVGETCRDAGNPGSPAPEPCPRPPALTRLSLVGGVRDAAGRGWGLRPEAGIIRWPVWELQPHQQRVSASPFPTVVGSILRVAVLRCSRQPPGWAWGGAQPGQSQQGPCVCVCVCVSVLCVPATPDGLRRKDRGRLSDLSEFCLIPAPTAAALPVVLRKGSRCARPPSPQRCGG